MKKIIVLLISLLSLSLATAQAPVVPKTLAVTRNDIYMIIDRVAFVYDVSPSVMRSIVMCESSYNTKAINTNRREVSRGLVQINTLAHKVTKKEAENPEYAVRFLAKHLKSGDADDMWVSCYKKAMVVLNS